jgi:chemotaxis regulatin CheY-phosphate phosphatase CheZ
MGRVGATKAKRRPQGRAKVKLQENGRSVSAEISLLLNTLRELAAIRSTAEDAAGRILESAENLLAFAEKEEAKKATDAILSIMTACGFHDLVGQRVTKITETLDQVIATRLKATQPGSWKGKIPAKAKSEITLEGPGFPNTNADQARIDALFNDN